MDRDRVGIEIRRNENEPYIILYTGDANSRCPVYTVDLLNRPHITAAIADDDEDDEYWWDEY